jgi:hypothetical protein
VSGRVDGILLKLERRRVELADAIGQVAVGFVVQFCLASSVRSYQSPTGQDCRAVVSTLSGPCLSRCSLSNRDVRGSAWSFHVMKRTGVVVFVRARLLKLVSGFCGVCRASVKL